MWCPNVNDTGVDGGTLEALIYSWCYEHSERFNITWAPPYYLDACQIRLGLIWVYNSDVRTVYIRKLHVNVHYVLCNSPEHDRFVFCLFFL